MSWKILVFSTVFLLHGAASVHGEENNSSQIVDNWLVGRSQNPFYDIPCPQSQRWLAFIATGIIGAAVAKVMEERRGSILTPGLYGFSVLYFVMWLLSPGNFFDAKRAGFSVFHILGLAVGVCFCKFLQLFVFQRKEGLKQGVPGAGGNKELGSGTNLTNRLADLDKRVTALEALELRKQLGEDPIATGLVAAPEQSPVNVIGEADKVVVDLTGNG
ncbi:MAG: hypothetical protein LBF72_02000 [Holosporales bacterium]|jgi:hypothetical protein|nr:hypothetical protein [Holosporales bacterium]